MKKLRTYLLVCALLLCIAGLAGCGNKGKLNEGDCAGVVSFKSIPKEFSLLEDNLQKDYEVRVTLKNLTTEKEYEIKLTQKNEFKKEISLHPGKYSVKAYATLEPLVHLPVKVADEIVTFDRGIEANVYVLADKYSGLIQVNHKVMPIKEIGTELDLSDMDKVIEGEQMTTLTDNERGISITLQNQMSTPQPLSKCEVLSLTVSKNTVVFPDGVTLGTAPEKICHKQTGLYGEPTRFEGMLLFGWDLESTKAVYLDPISGNRITICFKADGSAIRWITYDLKVFE